MLALPFHHKQEPTCVSPPPPRFVAVRCTASSSSALVNIMQSPPRRRKHMPLNSTSHICEMSRSHSDSKPYRHPVSLYHTESDNHHKETQIICTWHSLYNQEAICNPNFRQGLSSSRSGHFPHHSAFFFLCCFFNRNPTFGLQHRSRTAEMAA